MFVNIKENDKFGNKKGYNVSSSLLENILQHEKEIKRVDIEEIEKKSYLIVELEKDYIFNDNEVKRLFFGSVKEIIRAIKEDIRKVQVKHVYNDLKPKIRLIEGFLLGYKKDIDNGINLSMINENLELILNICEGKKINALTKELTIKKVGRLEEYKNKIEDFLRDNEYKSIRQIYTGLNINNKTFYNLKLDDFVKEILREKSN